MAMNWTDLLRSDAEATYHAAEGLLDMVDDSMLSYRPATGQNWMTTGQLIQHMTDACGACCRGFVSGGWGVAGDADSEMSADEMLPSAEKMPAASSVAEVRELLAADKALTLRMIEEAGEEALAGRMLSAPWNREVERPLGQHLLGMIGHLQQHKGQLFYYLKLMGKPVHTGHLWGM